MTLVRERYKDMSKILLILLLVQRQEAWPCCRSIILTFMFLGMCECRLVLLCDENMAVDSAQSSCLRVIILYLPQPHFLLQIIGSPNRFVPLSVTSVTFLFSLDLLISVFLPSPITPPYFPSLILFQEHPCHPPI